MISPSRLSTNGSENITSARPMSQTSSSRFRLKRSTMMPAAVARKKPGAIRVANTIAMAVPSLPPGLSFAAREIVASRPSQSPVAGDHLGDPQPEELLRAEHRLDPARLARLRQRFVHPGRAARRPLYHRGGP